MREIEGQQLHKVTGLRTVSWWRLCSHTPLCSMSLQFLPVPGWHPWVNNEGWHFGKVLGGPWTDKNFKNMNRYQVHLVEILVSIWAHIFPPSLFHLTQVSSSLQVRLVSTISQSSSFCSYFWLASLVHTWDRWGMKRNVGVGSPWVSSAGVWVSCRSS